MMYNNKASRGIAALLIATLLSVQCSLPMYSYADSIDTPEEITDIITEVIDTDEIAEDLEETHNEYIAESDDLSIEIPKDGGDGITIDPNEDEAVCMGLPKNVDWEEGVLSDGIITYGDENDDAALAVHAVKCDDDTICGVRAMITINNKDADHNYSFDFDLPKGYRLLKAEDYYAQFENSELEENKSAHDGEVYVVNDDNEISQIIEPAWAKDADGVSVKTHYNVEGDTLIQHISFDDETTFPVVADPNAINVVKVVHYFTKSQVKKIVDNYKGGSFATWLFRAFEGAAASALGVIHPGLLAAYSIVGVPAAEGKRATNRDTWVKLYKEFKKSKYTYLKVVTHVTRGRPYRAVGNMSVSFVNTKRGK